MTARIISITDRPGRCRSCQTTRYTVAELNVRPNRPWTCYICLDVQDRRHEADALAYGLMSNVAALNREKMRRMRDMLRNPTQIIPPPLIPQYIIDELTRARFELDDIVGINLSPPKGDETPPKDA